MFINQPNIREMFQTLQKRASNISVLLVEDDKLIMKEYLNFLRKIFTNITSKENGQEGLEEALSIKYDLIISDIEMPLINGLEMIEKIKEKHPNQVSLLISAHNDVDILHKSVQLGVNGFIFKPIDRYQMINALSKIVVLINLTKANEMYTIDSITGLYSLAKLEQDILEKQKHSLAFLKIRGFKKINNFYGYKTGNSILIQSADILMEIHKKLNLSTNNIYRMHGAHFAILSDMDVKSLQKVVAKIISIFESSTIDVDAQQIYFEMDAGIVNPHEEASLSHADTALENSKENNKIVIYKQDKNFSQKHLNRLHYMNEIKSGLKENRFTPYYQPIIDNTTHSIKKYEALARLIAADGKVISPEYFLSISKETKLYNMITKMIITKVLNDFKDSECSVSINVSIDDIKNNETSTFILKEISNFPQPQRLVLELLESESVDSYSNVREFFNKVKMLGCKIAIDDFGSGYANFEHIAKLNVDYIKIDGSLILEIEKDILHTTIVEMLANFANKMNIKTIAEYVSSDSIHKIVKSFGINESQGFLFGKPMPYNDSMKYIGLVKMQKA